MRSKVVQLTQILLKTKQNKLKSKQIPFKANPIQNKSYSKQILFKTKQNKIKIKTKQNQNQNKSKSKQNETKQIETK
jgi:hypothetical protein